MLKVTINKIEAHPNADRLDVLYILGFKTVVAKGLYTVGEEVLYYEPGLCFDLGKTATLVDPSYLKIKTDINGQKRGVIREVRLRGIMSEGLILPHEVECEKFAPPPSKLTMADADPDVANFPQYGSIENLRKAPNDIPDGALVTIVEKIHGTNSRVGFIRSADTGEVVLKAGSRTVVRRRPEGSITESLYWMPYALVPGVEKLLRYLADQGYQSATLYGELYGPTIQRYSYGLQNREVNYVAFGLRIDNKPVSYLLFRGLMTEFMVPFAPEIGVLVPYNYEGIKELAERKSDLAPDAGHLAEGVCIQYGTTTYKYVADNYLMSKVADKETSDL